MLKVYLIHIATNYQLMQEMMETTEKVRAVIVLATRRHRDEKKEVVMVILTLKHIACEPALPPPGAAPRCTCWDVL